MKKAILILSIFLSSFTISATIHIVKVWDGYMQFLSSDITIHLGDTIQWLPLDVPTMVHTITSTNIPAGAASFDQIWQAPADTFFQYIPQVAGMYEYVCTPHVTMGMVGSFDVIDPAMGITYNPSAESKISIFPNPTADIINFSKSEEVFPYKVLTPKGELVLSGKTNNKADVSELSKGIYHIIIFGDKPRTMKFIKL